MQKNPAHCEQERNLSVFTISSGSRGNRLRGSAFSIVAVNTDDKPHTGHIQDKRCTAVAYERQRKADYRQQPDDHSDIAGSLADNEQHDAADQHFAEVILCTQSYFYKIKRHSNQQKKYNQSTDKAHFLTENGKGKVSVRLR